MDNTHNEVVRIEHPSEVLPLMVELAEDGIRSVDIFSSKLDAAVYDDHNLVDAISAIARRSRQSQLRVLVRDPTSLYGSNRRLLSLVQRLPSRAQMKVYTEGAKDRYFGFFCVDRKHLVYFNDEDHWRGFVRRDARAESEHLLNEFEHLWLYGSYDDPNLRTLTL